jgi:hypothetical protein
MQGLTDGPRSEMAPDDVVSLIQDTPSVIVGKGLELLDMSLSVVADLSPNFVGGSVRRQSYADLHGSAELALSASLDWGTALVRPYLTMSGVMPGRGSLSARFNLGAYFTSTPADAPGETPRTYAIQGYDVIHRLKDFVGESYAVAAGTSYLAEVETILIDRGYRSYVIDQSASDKVLTSARTWPIDENTTWLTIVNALLSAVGYQGAWSDWDGAIRCTPYANPGDRSAEWVYDASDPIRSMVAVERRRELDFYEAPNRWITVKGSAIDEGAPSEGNGVYTVVNWTNGPTSVSGRGGRVVTAPLITVDAADQASLISAAHQRIDADMSTRSKLTVATAPNPLHWHFDRVALIDPEMDSPVIDALCTSWTLPLDGSDMSHEWSEV